ncbi:hypothetical protein [Lacinutrix chionoecetis]
MFTHPDLEGDNEAVNQFVEDLIYSGETWLSAYPINKKQTIRACITNFSTQIKDLKKLTHLLSVTLEKYK